MPLAFAADAVAGGARHVAWTAAGAAVVVAGVLVVVVNPPPAAPRDDDDRDAPLLDSPSPRRVSSDASRGAVTVVVPATPRQLVLDDAGTPRGGLSDAETPWASQRGGLSDDYTSGGSEPWASPVSGTWAWTPPGSS